MKRIILVSILCLGSALPPVPPAPKRNHRSAAVHQGAGAAKIIVKIVVARSQTNDFAWLYPPGIVASDYFWDIQQSASLAGPWTTLVTNASGVCEITANKSKPLSIYRLRAKFSP